MLRWRTRARRQGRMRVPVIREVETMFFSRLTRWRAGRHLRTVLVRARLPPAQVGAPAGRRRKTRTLHRFSAAERQVAWEETPGSGGCHTNRSRDVRDPVKPASRSDQLPNRSSGSAYRVTECTARCTGANVDLLKSTIRVFPDGEPARRGRSIEDDSQEALMKHPQCQGGSPASFGD
jgi:hypothetical protein